MRKAEFFRNHGSGVVKANNGDYLFIHSENVEIASGYISAGYTVVAVYKVEDDEYVDISQPCNLFHHSFKIGYYVLEVVNTSFNTLAYR